MTLNLNKFFSLFCVPFFLSFFCAGTDISAAVQVQTDRRDILQDGRTTSRTGRVFSPVGADIFMSLQMRDPQNGRVWNFGVIGKPMDHWNVSNTESRSVIYANYQDHQLEPGRDLSKKCSHVTGR